MGGWGCSGREKRGVAGRGGAVAGAGGWKWCGWRGMGYGGRDALGQPGSECAEKGAWIWAAEAALGSGPRGSVRACVSGMARETGGAAVGG